MATSPFRPELVRSCTDVVLLALLDDRPMYGYEVLVSLEERGNGELSLKQGTLYPLLYRLEREGWIKGKKTASPSGKKRVVYATTAAGRRVLAERLSEWKRFRGAVDSVLEELTDD